MFQVITIWTIQRLGSYHMYTFTRVCTKRNIEIVYTCMVFEIFTKTDNEAYRF